MKNPPALYHRLLLGVALAWPLLAGAAGLPQTLNYQGRMRLTSGAAVADSLTNNISFAIYSQPTLGTALWTEAQSNVATKDGLFNVILGSVTPLSLPFDQTYWLGINFNGDGEMSPRSELTMAPYAFRALYADNAAVAAPLSLTNSASDVSTVNAANLLSGTGVFARSVGAGTAPAIHGFRGGAGHAGTGVRAESGSTGTTGATALQAVNASLISGTYGITAESAGGIAVSATAGSNRAVYGRNSSGASATAEFVNDGSAPALRVNGQAAGVSVTVNNGMAVYGQNNGPGGFIPTAKFIAFNTNHAVEGRNQTQGSLGTLGGDDTNGQTGVYGLATVGSARGVHGRSGGGTGVQGEGLVGVAGKVTATGQTGVFADGGGIAGSLAFRALGNSVFDGIGNSTTFSSGHVVQFSGATVLGLAPVVAPLGLTSSTGSPALYLRNNGGGRALEADNNAATPAIYAQNLHTTGVAIHGINAVGSNNGTGVRGEIANGGASSAGVSGSNSGAGYGVIGFSSGGVGVYGSTNMPSAHAIHGYQANAGGTGAGVYGNTASGAGYGVSAENVNGGVGLFARGTPAIRIQGDIDANTNRIINLVNPSGLQDAATKDYVDQNLGAFVQKAGDTMSGGLTVNTGGTAIYGFNGSIGVSGQGSTYGVYGSSPASYGVFGQSGGSGATIAGVSGANSSSGPGVHGNANSGPGVLGTSTTGEGVRAESNSGPSAGLRAIHFNTGYGVHGSSNNGIGIFGTGSGNHGVMGQTFANTYAGVMGVDNSSSGGVGVWGNSDLVGGVAVRGRNIAAGGRALLVEGSALFGPSSGPASVSFATHVDFSGATVTGLSLGVAAPLSLSHTGAQSTLSLYNSSGVGRALYVQSNASSTTPAAEIINNNANNIALRVVGGPSTGGIGVLGQGAVGVYGQNAGTATDAMWAIASGAASKGLVARGEAIGISATATGTASNAIYAHNNSTISTVRVQNNGAGVGLDAESVGTAIQGSSSSANGVYGYSSAGGTGAGGLIGGYSGSGNGYGVRAFTTAGAPGSAGVMGAYNGFLAYPTAPNGMGVVGINDHPVGYGVYAIATNTAGAIAMVARGGYIGLSATSLAGPAIFGNNNQAGSATAEFINDNGTGSPLKINALRFPSNTGSASQVLTTDGIGQMSWANAPAPAAPLLLSAASNNPASVIKGINTSSSGAGVRGETSSGSLSYGVVGEEQSAHVDAAGVMGLAGGAGIPSGIGNQGIGVVAVHGSGGHALYARSIVGATGRAIVAEGTAIGLSATASSATGSAIYARANSGNPATSLINDGSGLAIIASSTGDTGVIRATATDLASDEGVIVGVDNSTGSGQTAAGVYGFSGNNVGTAGYSGGTLGTGVLGNGGLIGVRGSTSQAAGRGMVAEGISVGLSATASANNGIAGHFQGVTGVVAIGSVTAFRGSAGSSAAPHRVTGAVITANSELSSAVGLHVEAGSVDNVAWGIFATAGSGGDEAVAIYGLGGSGVESIGVRGRSNQTYGHGVHALNLVAGGGSTGSALLVGGPIRISPNNLNDVQAGGVGCPAATTHNFPNGTITLQNARTSACATANFWRVNNTYVGLRSTILLTFGSGLPSAPYVVRANTGFFEIHFYNTGWTIPAGTSFNYVVINQ